MVTPLQLVGNTPLLALERCHTGPGRLLAKAEFMMPGGSVKDRAALAILRAARADGRLKPGQTVVEMTSGNMGAGLAVVCAALGHPFVATMSAGNSPARAVMMEGLGARVVLTPQVDGAPGQVTGADIAAATAEAQRIAREERAFYVDQFNAAEGIAAHEVTGAEILRQAGHVDAFVAAVGTGCTFIGIARALKVANPATLCAPVEPEGSEPLMGKPVVKPRHLLQGTSYGLVPPHWDAGLVDFGMTVSDEEVTDWKARLATREGLYVGYSAAANVCAASRLLSSGRLREGATVLTVLCDTGLKY
ncbi:PLP-dependent cysteine synthase family protein [Sagittula salina]|uniref:Cysteine synthase family protein n=1 Tax=Sagittula salina TaxID=2820268 RepID=A0A940MQ45_9RHOB|nr:cysteine synthase family protein [Sagittula salina]MBP0482701.1 cysteine synthase family protein [Sagittula salina]